MTKSFLMFLCSVFMWKMKYTKRGKPCFKVFMRYCWEASHNVKGLWPRQSREGRTEECSDMVSEHRRPQSPSSSRAVILALSSWGPRCQCSRLHVTKPSLKLCPADVPLLLATAGFLILATLWNLTTEEDWFLQDPAKPRPPRSDLFPLFKKHLKFFMEQANKHN